MRVRLPVAVVLFCALLAALACPPAVSAVAELRVGERLALPPPVGGI